MLAEAVPGNSGSCSLGLWPAGCALSIRKRRGFLSLAVDIVMLLIPEAHGDLVGNDLQKEVFYFSVLWIT